jgi:hypothetical protein
MTVSEKKAEDLGKLVKSAASRLPDEAVSRLLANPDALAGALAAIAATLDRPMTSEPELLGQRLANRLAVEEAQGRLDERTRTIAPKGLIGSDEVAARAGLKSRQSVHNWFKKGRIVGWKSAKRGLVFPARQLDKRGRPPEGLSEILPLFADGFDAWSWLTSSQTSLEGKCPLDLLREGRVEIVVAAAESEGQGDFA